MSLEFADPFNTLTSGSIHKDSVDLSKNMFRQDFPTYFLLPCKMAVYVVVKSKITINVFCFNLCINTLSK